jgi:hypothetical protein
MLPLATGSGGELFLNRDVNITNGSMSFSDVHLALTVTSGQITFSEISVGVDADQVTLVSEPPTYALLLAGVGFFGLPWLRRRTRLARRVVAA